VTALRRLLVASLWAMGCASTGPFTCPPPIGDIVREDCERYRVRYDTVSAKVSAQVEGAQTSLALKREAIREPSELMQVMAHRATALCEDFNACRMSVPEYRQHRDEIDHTFTVVSSLSGQLQNQSLTPDDKQRIISKIMDALGQPKTAAPPPAAAPASAPREEGRITPAERPRKRFFSDHVWYGARYLPPHPPPVKEGFPRLLAGGRKPMSFNYYIPDYFKEKGERDGWVPTFHVDLFGAVEPDDQVIVTLGDLEMKCLVRADTKGAAEHVAIPCAAGEKKKQTRSGGEAVVHYRRAATGETATLGRLPFRMLERAADEGARPGMHVYGLDLDWMLDAAWLEWAPEPRELPPDFDRPIVRTTLKLRKFEKATLRCQVGGQVVTGAVEASGERGTGQEDMYQDLPRWRDEMHEGHKVSVGVEHPFIEWWTYAFPLPFVIPRAGAPVPEGLGLLSDHPGAWKCRIQIGGEPVREVRFSIGRDGAPVPHTRQQGRAGDIDWPWWRVEVLRLPNSVEVQPPKGR